VSAVNEVSMFDTTSNQIDSDVSEGGIAVSSKDWEMLEIVRAAQIQTIWTSDKQSMIEANVTLAREAASQGATIVCFQELFYGPYFCQVRDPEYFSYTEAVLGGPTTELM